jgi:hypothetical protein
MIYSLLDGLAIIDEPHLRAALAVWAYADASALLIFGAEPEDPLVVEVLVKLKEAGARGMTRTDLHNAYNRNLPAAQLLEALAKLRDRGDAYAEKLRTGKPGAPSERWYARRINESKESTPDVVPDQAADGIDSFNSSLRPPSPDTTVSEEEVVIV